MDVSTAPNRNVAFSLALFDELMRSGVHHVCLCPGSRSTPLVVAAVQTTGLRRWSQIDERSAAFFALGLARASREPVALVCTSGTAAANFLPAVIEAHYSRVPLIVLTADRPAELRDWGADQTIDQTRLYGSHVRWFAEAAEPEPSEQGLRYARALACRAVEAAVGPFSGPVHLNLPFREPLEPVQVPGDAVPVLAERGTAATRGREEMQPYACATHSAAVPSAECIARLLERVTVSSRGVVVCGPLDAHPDLAEGLVELARALGWPLLADPASRVRFGPHTVGAPIVATSDWLLRDTSFTDSHTPDVVLRFGSMPTSKAFRLWLERSPPNDLIVVDPAGGWRDPSHLASSMLRVDPLALCDRLARRLPGSERVRSSDWFDGWLAADRRARSAIDNALDGSPELLEARVVRELFAALPDGALVTASNSMPIRDLDGFLPASPKDVRVLCNRGANGIDGMVSSALGASAANSGRPAVLLTGDLAFLHDVGGLIAARRSGLPLAIVVIDNDGGGIFSHLPVAEYRDEVAFEENFTTPHGQDLAALCEGLGIAVTRAESLVHLTSAIKDALVAGEPSVVVVSVDRDRNVAQFRAIVSRVGEAL